MLLHARRAFLFCNTEKTENGHYPPQCILVERGLQGPAMLGENKYGTTTCLRPDFMYSCKQRFTFEDLSGNDSKLLLLTGQLKILT